MFKILLWRKIDNVTSYSLISSEYLERKHSFKTDRFRNYQLLNVTVWEGRRNIRERMRQRYRALVSNHCLISHCRYDIEKLTVQCSSNLKAQRKVLCWRDERKICYILFSEMKGKRKIKLLQNHWGGWLFCGEFQFLLLKLMFNHSASCWSCSPEVVETLNKR